jgi:hypothetical protein
MSGLVFVKHERVRITDGAYKDETGTIAADVPLSNSGALKHAPVLLDWHDHGGAKYIPLEHLERIPAPVDLTSVRSGLASVTKQLDTLAPFEQPLGRVATALDTLRAAVEDLAGEVEKLARGGESR